jgi:hypothetical protein
MAKKNGSSNLLQNNKVILAIIGLALVFVFIGFLSFLKGFYQTETYYVLNDEYGTSIPARTLVQPDMLSPMVIADGTAPPTAIGLSEIVDGYVYTKFALEAGDVLTASNAGAVDDIYLGVPDNWVITNFSVDADSAVGGRIHAGDYFDILVNTDGGSFYPFVNVLALDTTVDLSGASNAGAAETDEAYAGQTSQYVVAMSPENAAKLQGLAKKHSADIKLVMSPKQNEYNKPRLSDYSGMFSFKDNESPIWSGKSDTGEISDSEFNRVQRNAAGEPLEKIAPRNEGNLRSSERIDISNDVNHPDTTNESDSSTTTEDGSSTDEETSN